MHLMNWIVPIASFLEILLLLYVAMIDIATRLIRNEICLVLALLGIASQFASPMHVTESLIAAKDFDMSSTLRLSIIMVLLLATAALGLIAYTNMNPKPVVQVTENTPGPPTIGYFVAAHPLPVGTLARDEDFEVRSVSSDS